MSSNSIDFEMAKLEAEIHKGVEDFIKDHGSTVRHLEIKEYMQDIADKYFENGTVERRILIDINHIEELDFLKMTYDFRKEVLKNAPTKKMELDMVNEMGSIGARMDRLRSQVSSGAGLKVYLKEFFTYDPYDWAKYDFGEREISRDRD